MAEVPWYGLIMLDMKESGNIIMLVERESSSILMAISMMVNGSTTRPMASEFTLMLRELDTKGTGKRINSTAMESRHGQRAQNMKVIMQ